MLTITKNDNIKNKQQQQKGTNVHVLDIHEYPYIVVSKDYLLQP